MKFSRPLSLILVLLFVFPLSITCFASSDVNLIDSDLTNWENYSDYDSQPYPITPTYSNGVYRLTLTQQTPPMYYGVLFNESSFVAGHSYTLSFRFPTRQECNSAFGNSYSLSVYENHFKNSTIFIGYGYYTNGEFVAPDSGILFNITADNYTNYFGKSVFSTFVAPSYSGTPFIYINIVTNDGDKHTFYFSDFKLVDNDDNSAELDGIKGFLHNIYWDLVGGSCGEACSPHFSLSERIGQSFENFFLYIGDELKSLGDNLLEGIENFFRGLGNLLLYFNWEGDYENPFESADNPLDKLNSFFDGLNDYVNSVGQSIENMLDSVTGGLEIFDRFTARFPWLKGIAVFCLAIIVLSKVIGL